MSIPAWRHPGIVSPFPLACVVSVPKLPRVFRVEPSEMARDESEARK